MGGGGGGMSRVSVQTVGASCSSSMFTGIMATAFRHTYGRVGLEASHY